MPAIDIPTRSNGQTILASWFNTIRSYLIQHSLEIETKVADYAFTGDVNTVLADSNAVPVTITLPDATLNKGRKFRIIVKDITNGVNVDSSGGNILGSATYTFKMNYESITFFSDEVNWYAI